jgi:hypothetical protein
MASSTAKQTFEGLYTSTTLEFPESERMLATTTANLASTRQATNPNNQPKGATSMTLHANMTIPEAAEYLRISKGALANLRYQGRGGPPYLRLTPKTILYRRDALDAWLDAAERTGTAA